MSSWPTADKNYMTWCIFWKAFLILTSTTPKTELLSHNPGKGLAGFPTQNQKQMEQEGYSGQVSPRLRWRGE